MLMGTQLVARVTLKSSHCIRRTFASRLYAEGMPLEEISVCIWDMKLQIQRKAISTITNEIEKNRAYMNKAL